MKALITGASSGIGRDIAKVLSSKGYDIIAVARRRERLEELKKELKTEVEIITADVTDEEECYRLAERAGEVDILVNNAGFGILGEFINIDLDTEMKMIDTNIKAVHILTKLFLAEFKKRDSGYILNVGSIASFFPGPLFATYYATKSYVLRLTQSVAEELRQEKSRVKISVLCPGPVNTEFSDIAGMSFGVGKFKVAKLVVLDSPKVAKYAIDKMFSGKEVIVPSALMKASAFCRRILPDKALAKIFYKIQNMKFVRNK